MPRNLLLVCAALFGFFGLWGLLSPEGMAATIGIKATAADGVNDLRAMYGGLELGLAAVLGWHALTEDRVSDGLVIAALTIGGLGAARGLSMLVTEVTAMSTGLTLLEVGTAVVCFWFSQRS